MAIKQFSLMEVANMRATLAGIPRGAKITDFCEPETLSRRVVLEEDRIDVWEQLALQPHLQQPVFWAKENMARAMQKNPEVLAYWAKQHESSVSYFVNKVGRHIDFLRERVLPEERLAMLQGQTCEKATGLAASLHNVLQKYPSMLVNLSPAWLGEEQSALRGYVETIGWKPAMLAQMSRNHAHFVNADRWVPLVAYPYTLWLLEYHKKGPNPNDPPIWQTQNEVYFMVANNANPHDVVMAQALLMQSEELQENVSFGIPENIAQACAQMPQSERAYFESLVATHMALGMETELGVHLVQPGSVVFDAAQDMLTLPDFGHD